MKSAVLLSAVSATSNRNSVWYDLGDGKDYAIAVAFTGGAGDLVGTVSLQGAVGTDNANTDVNAVIATITGSSTAVTASSNVIYTYNGAGYRWVRAVWVFTSGTGNITVKLDEKEPQQKL